MKKRVFSVLFLSLVGAMMVVPASADSLYSSGPVNGGFGAWQINGAYAVTDSFTETYTGTVISATFAVWLIPGDSLSSVNWSLSSGQYGGGTVYGSGTATPTTPLPGSFISTGLYAGYNVVTESISGLDVPLTAGIPYYFTLKGAAGPGIAADGAYWDENNGTSTGYSNALAGPPYNGSIGAYNGSGSGGETFALYSPEPSSLLLLGSGLVGLAGLLKRKLTA